MAWTQEDITALETTIASGKRQVQFKDRSVTFQSIGEMLELLRSMRSDVADNAGTSLRTTYAEFSKD